MFTQWKQKLTEKFNQLSGQPQDPLETQINDVVAKATSELLIGPDWSANMELVDIVLSHPSASSDKAIKALHRSLLKPNAKVQLLTLTVLETCIKNCGPGFYNPFATSGLFTELQRMAAEQGVHRLDAEVRDKMLCLIEDCGKGIRMPQYRQAYESLLDQGVDFPVRPEDSTPFLNLDPPQTVNADPLANVSEEDRAAIAAAMAEMEAEARGQQQRAPAATGQAAGYVPPVPVLVGEAPVVGSPVPLNPFAVVAPAPVAPVAAPPPAAVNAENAEADIQISKNTVELLNEMLGTLSDAEPAGVREPFISELAERCLQLRSRMEDYIETLTDEKQLEDCFGAHEEMQKSLARYNELCVKADAQVLAVAAAAAAAEAPPPPVHRPPPSQPLAPTVVAPAGAFTIIDDEDEVDDEQESLMTHRMQGMNASLESDYGMPTPPPVLQTTLNQPDLIDFGADEQEPPLPVSSPASDHTSLNTEYPPATATTVHPAPPAPSPPPASTGSPVSPTQVAPVLLSPPLPPAPTPAPTPATPAFQAPAYTPPVLPQAAVAAPPAPVHTPPPAPAVHTPAPPPVAAPAPVAPAVHTPAPAPAAPSPPLEPVSSIQQALDDCDLDDPEVPLTRGIR